MATAYHNTTLIPSRTTIDFVTPEVYDLCIKASIIFRFAICVVGIWTNSINIRAFYRMGLEDSVTIVFFCLALSDFVHLFGGLLDVFADAAVIFEDDLSPLEFPPAIVSRLISVFIRAFNEITYLSTTFLALQRCLCVARPLHFKGMFTRLRTFTILAVIWLFSFVLTSVLLYYSSAVKRAHDPLTNSSRYFLTFRPGREVFMSVYTTTFSIVLNTANQLVVMCCVFVMAHALNKSVRFRQIATKSGGAPERFQQKPDPYASDLQDNKASAASLMTNTKERQAIVQVSLVSTIFLICNFARLTMAFSVVIQPEFDLMGTFHYSFLLFYNYLSIFEYINSSVNFFIYYKYNSKFRSVCFGYKA